MMRNRRLFLLESLGAVAAVLGVVKAVAGRPDAQALSVPRGEAEVSGGAAVPSGIEPAAVSGMADMSGMTIDSGMVRSQDFKYLGHQVHLADGANNVMATVDGRVTVHVMRVDHGGLHTHLLPFTVYQDGPSLMRDVIDCARQGLFIL